LTGAIGDKGVLDTFEGCKKIDRIIVVMNSKNIEDCRSLVAHENWDKVRSICLGGKKRQDSVLEGLKRMKEVDWVVIHDGARPCISPDLIERGLIAAQESGAAIAGVPVKDTIKIVSRRGFVQQTPARQCLWAAQTPQVFCYDLIMEAYSQADDEVTDDAALVGGVHRLGDLVHAQDSVFHLFPSPAETLHPDHLSRALERLVEKMQKPGAAQPSPTGTSSGSGRFRAANASGSGQRSRLCRVEGTSVSSSPKCHPNRPSRSTTTGSTGGCWPIWACGLAR
jgi:2-C-methyl-D-erythritol 4-phosphate cytidylyltransferase